MLPNTTDLSDEEYRARHYRVIRGAAWCLGGGILGVILLHHSLLVALPAACVVGAGIVLLIKGYCGVMSWITDRL
jgi:hypothetical protein